MGCRRFKVTIILSWSELSESARELGCLLSLFALAPISWSLVEKTAVEQDPEQDLEELEDARFELQSLHLLQGENTYRLHQLIREFFRNKQQKLAVAEGQKQALAAAMAAIASEISPIPTREDIELVKDNIPHLAEVAENLTVAISDEDLALVFLKLAVFYEGQGLYRLAEPWLEQGVSVVKNRLGEDHSNVAFCLDYQAKLYLLQGRYAEAEPMFLQALELYKWLVGEEHPGIALNLNNLAQLYYIQGRYAEAEPMYLQALELLKQQLGEDDVNVARCLDNLAKLYVSQGR